MSYTEKEIVLISRSCEGVGCNSVFKIMVGDPQKYCCRDCHYSRMDIKSKRNYGFLKPKRVKIKKKSKE